MHIVRMVFMEHVVHLIQLFSVHIQLSIDIMRVVARVGNQRFLHHARATPMLVVIIVTRASALVVLVAVLVLVMGVMVPHVVTVAFQMRVVIIIPEIVHFGPFAFVSAFFETERGRALPPDFYVRVSAFQRALTGIKQPVFGTNPLFGFRNRTMRLAVRNLTFLFAFALHVGITKEFKFEGRHHALRRAVVELNKTLTEARALEVLVVFALASLQALFDLRPASGYFIKALLFFFIRVVVPFEARHVWQRLLLEEYRLFQNWFSENRRFLDMDYGLRNRLGGDYMHRTHCQVRVLVSHVVKFVVFSRMLVIGLISFVKIMCVVVMMPVVMVVPVRNWQY